MNRIKDLRLRNRWRQSDLADALNTKQQTIARYESGEREPDIDTILRLCDIFGCTADYLLGRSANPSPVISDADTALLQAYHAAPPSVAEAISVLLQPYQKDEAENAV